MLGAFISKLAVNGKGSPLGCFHQSAIVRLNSSRSSPPSFRMSQLPNYLLSNRKRLLLSQEEVAFLLGNHGGAKVSRHERFSREPSLTTALAYEAIYKRPASELFGGLYKQIQADVAARAKTLTQKADHGKPNSKTALRRQILTSIADKSLN